MRCGLSRVESSRQKGTAGCKGPEPGACLVYLRSNKEASALEQREQGECSEEVKSSRREREEAADPRDLVGLCEALALSSGKPPESLEQECLELTYVNDTVHLVFRQPHKEALSTSRFRFRFRGK